MTAARTAGEFTTVRVEIDDDGIGWLYFARPDKRNAMSPTLNREMITALELLEAEESVRCVVLTGDGDAWSAGMDLKEYFREVDDAPPHVEVRARRDSAEWQWRRLIHFPKPTIAMVNGWCFGGAFTPLVCCDLAIAAEDATFGLSEVNWGIPPGGLVSRALAETVPSAGRALVHHDRRDVRRPPRRRDAAGQRGGPGRRPARAAPTRSPASSPG